MFEIPLTTTTLGEEEIEAAARVLRRRWVTQGEEVAAFEREFAETLGCRHAVAVSNGTAALEIAFAVAGIGPGDEVLLPAITFVACLNAVRRLGARAVLADVASETDLTICIDDLHNKITERTRLIVPMPHGGFCPRMPELMEIARGRGIAVIEDACHAPLAGIDGRRIGTFGLAGTWSFFGNKNLTTGEGGMITTDGDEFAAQCRLMRSHGITRTTWDRARGHASDYDVALVGTNARMDEIRAAIGRVQLAKLPAATARRAEAAGCLYKALTERAIAGLQICGDWKRGKPVHHVFCVILPEGSDRRRAMEALGAEGIQTSIHYPPLHHFSATREYFARGGAEGLPVSERVAERILTLPLGPEMTPDQCRRVADSLARALNTA